MPQPKSSPAEVSMPTFATLEEWTRSQVQELMQSVLEEEVTHVLGRARYERLALLDAPRGHRNGYGKPRRLSFTSGTIEVKRPRVRGLDERFESAILPLFARRTQEVGQLLPELYLHGLSQGDFELALRGLLGKGAPLSPSSIARLRDKWIVEYTTWRTRRLDNRELVYAWADGIYVKAGLEKQKAALLVVIGAMSDGRKEILTIVPGYRESSESWADVLRDLRDRGPTAPVLLAADGHLGIWAGLAEIWPHTAEQRCWNHRILNVLNKLPKTVQGEARGLLTQIPYAPTRQEAKKRRDQFAKRFRGQYRGAARARLEPRGDVLRLPRSPLATPAHYKRYRKSLRFSAAANRCGQALQEGGQCHHPYLASADGRRETIPKTQCTASHDRRVRR